MTTHDKLNELNQAEEPAKELLRRLGYLYMSREVLAAERDNEREVLLKGRLKAALLRLNPWMAQEHAERAIFNLENIDAVGMARNQAVHEYLTYGMPLDVDEPGGRRTRTVQFFDFDHPLPEGGRNEFIVTTQFRVRRGNEPSGHGTEDDERVVKPDLVLFVNGIPLVVMEAKSPSLLDVWKYRAVRQLRRYQEATPEWQGTGAPALFDYNLMCIDTAAQMLPTHRSVEARTPTSAGSRCCRSLRMRYARSSRWSPRARRNSSSACSTLRRC